MEPSRLPPSRHIHERPQVVGDVEAAVLLRVDLECFHPGAVGRCDEALDELRVVIPADRRDVGKEGDRVARTRDVHALLVAQLPRERERGSVCVCVRERESKERE